MDVLTAELDGTIFSHRTLCSLAIYIVKVLVTQFCPTLVDPMDVSPPGSSVNENFQARILEWVAISSSRGSSQPRDPTQVSHTAGGFLPSEPPGNPSTVL